MKALVNTYKQKYIKQLEKELEMHKAGTHIDRKILFIMNQTNISIWYGLIFGLDKDDVFANGQYIIELKASEDYPRKPPVFRYYTPNGVFNKDSSPCINMGHYHADNYPATLGMTGFGEIVLEALRGYKDLISGASIIDTTPEYKKECASTSVKYNENNYPQILEQFRKHVIETGIRDMIPNAQLFNFHSK